MQPRICVLSGWNGLHGPPSVEDMTPDSTHHGRTAVQVLDVRKSYPSGQDRVWALRGAFLALAPGSFTAIMGPSASGKSTLLQCAAGLESPDSGRITIGDHVISDLSADGLTRFRREHIGFVFQDYNLVGHLDVNANIALALVLGGKQLDPAWRDHLLTSVGLGGLQSRRPSQLSGGQAQRVAIARALASRPTVVFADEPTGALDSHTARDVLEVFRSTAERLRQTVVMVTHDPRVASTADRVLFLADGLVVDDMDAPTVDGVGDRMLTLGR